MREPQVYLLAFIIRVFLLAQHHPALDPTLLKHAGVATATRSALAETA